MNLIVFFVFAAASLAAVSEGKRIVCYFASWTVYRHGNGAFDIDDIDTSLCTHINFGFIGLNTDGTIMIIDPWESNDDGLKGFHRLVALKEQKPGLKVLVSMGGWNEGSEKYSQVAADPDKRKVLVREVDAFLDKYGFDGFDLDWEYPGVRNGSNPDIDPTNFVELLKELKAVLQPKGYLLTAAVGGAVTTIDTAYDIPVINDLLDFMDVMVYDFHGAFDNYVGHVSPLNKSHLDDAHAQQNSNVIAGIEHWLEKGADPEKISLGIATYGRSFELADESNTELYAPIIGGGTAGPYTNQTGVLGYNEICEFHSSWPSYWDDEQQVSHKISGNQWVGYEDEISVQRKVEYAVSKKLGGIMIWSFDTDDFRGICGGGKYPILKTINEYFV